MSRSPDVAYHAMRDLWLRSDAYLQAAVEAGTFDVDPEFPGVTLPAVSVTTPGGLTISKTEHLLTLSMDTLTRNGKSVDDTYTVEYDWGINDYPTVQREVWSASGRTARIETVRRKKFPRVARILGAMLNPAEQPVSLAP